MSTMEDHDREQAGITAMHEHDLQNRIADGTATEAEMRSYDEDRVTKAIATIDENDDRATNAEINRARQEYANNSDDNIEIDEEAKASRGDDGVWVAAWVWLADNEEEEEDDNEDI